MVKKRRLNTASKGKSRDPISTSGDEVSSARDRFKGALQHLLPRSDEDSDSSDDDHWPTKKRISIHRKKQIKTADIEKIEPDTTKFQQSFVMKLFDRSVDLAQFNENSPLYPICRAWIANQPHQVYNTTNKSGKLLQADHNESAYVLKDEKDFDSTKDLHLLPPPNIQMKGSDKMRVPDKVTYITKYTSIQHDGTDPPSKDKILKDNLIHWNNVRKSWLDAYAKNEMRYKCSIKLLSAMFNRAQRNFQSQ